MIAAARFYICFGIAKPRTRLSHMRCCAADAVGDHDTTSHQTRTETRVDHPRARAGRLPAVLLPFVSALFWAVILSFSSWPIYRRLVELRLGGRRTLAASLMALAMFCVILLPFVIVGATLGDNVKELTTATQTLDGCRPPPPPAWLAKLPGVGPKAGETGKNLAADSSKLLAAGRVHRAGKRLVAHRRPGLAVAARTGPEHSDRFFLFRDGNAAKRLASPSNGLPANAASTARSSRRYGARRGLRILGTALVQAVMAGIGFLIAGVPGAALLALLTFFLSVVPVGPPLVWLPAAFWLFHQGSTGWGIFMLIWGVASAAWIMSSSRGSSARAAPCRSC